MTGKTDTCVKCGSGDLVKVPSIPGDAPHIALGERVLHHVQVDRYVCTACGFIEAWVYGEADLARLREEYGQKR